MSQLNADLSYLREQLLVKKTSKTQNLNTEMQNLLTRIACLEEEKAKLQEMLESVREEETNLRRDLQESEQTVSNMGSKCVHSILLFAGVDHCLQTLFSSVNWVFHPFVETQADGRA